MTIEDIMSGITCDTMEKYLDSLGVELYKEYIFTKEDNENEDFIQGRFYYDENTDIINLLGGELKEVERKIIGHMVVRCERCAKYEDDNIFQSKNKDACNNFVKHDITRKRKSMSKIKDNYIQSGSNYIYDDYEDYSYAVLPIYEMN